VSGKPKHQKRPAMRGQGVVEYAGSLVIAAIIVAAGLIIVPPNFSAMINTIYSTMASFLGGQLPS